MNNDHDFHQRGFTLLETLIAAALIVLFTIPAVEALRTVRSSTAESQQIMHRHRHLQARMESLLAMPYEDLADEATNKDAVTIFSDPPGSDPRRLVYISHYDGDATGPATNPFISGEQDYELLWIRVTLENSDDELTTLVSL